MRLKTSNPIKKAVSFLLVGMFVVGGIVQAAPAKNSLAEVEKPTDVMIHRVENAEAKYSERFGNEQLGIEATDPVFAENMKRFTYGEVEQQGNLSDKERALLTIVILETQGSHDLLRMNIEGALKVATPIEIKEAVYHITPYIGFDKAIEALKITNEIFVQKGIELPLPDQSTVTEQDRFDKGLAVQRKIFGPSIDALYEVTPKEQMHIMHYLSGYCFGDTYTRKALDLKMREMLTMVTIATLGGCEPQLKSHVNANLNVGNSKETIRAAITECVPYIGFPRALNAMNCVEQVFAARDKH